MKKLIPIVLGFSAILLAQTLLQQNYDVRNYAKGSKTGGIAEAAAAAGAAGGGVVFIPAGTYSITSAIHVPSKVTIRGAGQDATVLRLPNNSISATSAWQVTGVPSQYCVICFDPTTSLQHVSDLTIDTNGSNNPWFYFTEVMGYNASSFTVERVTVKNHPIAGGTGTMFTALGTTSRYAKFINTRSMGIPNCTVPNGGGAYYLEGTGHQLINAYASDFCDSAFVLANCIDCFIVGAIADLASGQMATPTYSFEGVIRGTLANSKCIGSGTNGHRYCVGLASINNAAGAVISTGNRIIDVTGQKVSTMLAIGQGNPGFTSTDPVKDTEVIGMYAKDAVLECVLLSEYVDGVKILGSTFTNCETAGGGAAISIVSTGTTVVKNVVIDGVRIDHAKTSGIVGINSTSGDVVNGLTIRNSWIGDSSGSPVQQYGILFTAGTVTDAHIAGNTFVGNTIAPVYYQGSFTRAILGPNTTDKADSGWAAGSVGAAVASASSITPTGEIFHVTGTTAINTISLPSTLGAYYAGCITLIPDEAFPTTTAGNIAIASTAVVGRALRMCYDGSAAAGTGRWYPSY